jgi:HEAT repeat protein
MTVAEFIEKVNQMFPQFPTELLGPENASPAEKAIAIQLYSTALKEYSQQGSEQVNGKELATDWLALTQSGTDILPELCESFPAQSQQIRSLLVRCIGMLNTPESLRALHQILQMDPSVDVRGTAAEQLGEYGGPEEEKMLLELLDTPCPPSASSKGIEETWQEMKSIAIFGAVRDIRWGVTHGLGHL